MMFKGALCALALAVAAPAVAQTPPDARAIIADLRKIGTPNGVEQLVQIDVGGTKQWISVRGKNRDNPILLFIHGGPASPEMPASWAFQTPWEDYFTVVQWDQRGAGKTFLANDPAAIAPTLNIARMTEDAAEVVQYLRKTYGKDKVFVLGHSWGSVLGLSLAQKHPELLYAYVGVGQVVEAHANEQASYDGVLKLAEAAGNARAIQELKAIAPYPGPAGAVPLEKIGPERKWVVALGGMTHNRDSFAYSDNAALISPDYSAADVAAVEQGQGLSSAATITDLSRNFDARRMTKLQVPIVLFLGRYDLATPSTVAAEWFKTVEAPQKKAVWFEDSAHMMFFEEPGRFLVHLVQDVRPLAKD
jgi:proline iminopeptidase